LKKEKNIKYGKCKLLVYTVILLCCVCSISIVIRAAAAANKPLKSSDGMWEYLAGVDGHVTITKYIGDQAVVAIPGKIEGMVVSAIGKQAFEKCESLYSITIPDNIMEIGELAFNGCINLSKVVLPKNITCISGFMFDACSSIESIIIPDSVTDINACAFYGCSSLKSIVLPNSVKSIGNRAFSRCTALTSITIPESVSNIGDQVFEGVPNTLTIYVVEGSYAERYAADKHISVELIQSTVPGANNTNPSFPSVSKQKQEIKAESFTKVYGCKSFYLGAVTSGNGILSYSSSNKKVASVDSTGKVSVKGCGETSVAISAQETNEYNSAASKITITVIPKAVLIKKAVSPSRGEIQYEWKKHKTISGYEIYIDTNKSFKMKQSTSVTKDRVSLKINNALSGKTYYMKIRAYKNIGKKKCYGKWSKVRKVKVK
jgi:hypothetical protein